MILLPDGRVVEPRSRLPEGDLMTSRGRRVMYRGRHRINHQGQEILAGVWVTADGLRILASMDRTPHGELLHVSVSRASCDPSWNDLLEVRYAFFGDDIDCMMVMPKNKDYVNLCEHAFHIWQTPFEWGCL